MSIQNTTTTPQFLEEEPDWSKPVSLEIGWKTEILSARDGSEQRSRRRERGKIRFSYIISSLTVAQFSQRRAKGILEQGAALVVPIWTDKNVLNSTVGTGSGAVATMMEPALAQNFKPGCYAYFVQSGRTSAFRRVTAVDLETGDVTLAAGSGEFTASAAVYPCVVGLPVDGMSFVAAKLDDSDETVSIEEL